jgi:hypothetical protein
VLLDGDVLVVVGELLLDGEPVLDARPDPEAVPELDPEADPETFDPCGSTLLASVFVNEPPLGLAPAPGCVFSACVPTF